MTISYQHGREITTLTNDHFVPTWKGDNHTYKRPFPRVPARWTFLSAALPPFVRSGQLTTVFSSDLLVDVCRHLLFTDHSSFLFTPSAGFGALLPRFHFPPNKKIKYTVTPSTKSCINLI